MALIVYVSIFPGCCLICVHMPISGLLFPLFYWCNSIYMPNARVSVCTVRRPACCKELLSVNAGPQTPLEARSVDYLDLSYCTWELVIARDQICVKKPYFTIFCGKLCRIGQDHAEPGEKQDHRSDRKWWKGYSRGRSW